RTWFRLLGAGPLVLLVAFLPSLVYVGHWGDYVDFALGRSRAVEEPTDAEHATHEAHCHVGPSTCADQPAFINGQVAASVVEMTVPHLSTTVLEDALVTLEGQTVAPLTEPPRG
ncbi:MAG: hypothetical protein Q8S13_00020, partial [Dehalococcoidia bacterium]|nr:hypothetical protein [Dehalococcoidia bacterium]